MSNSPLRHLSPLLGSPFGDLLSVMKEISGRAKLEHRSAGWGSCHGHTLVSQGIMMVLQVSHCPACWHLGLGKKNYGVVWGLL